MEEKKEKAKSAQKKPLKKDKEQQIKLDEVRQSIGRTEKLIRLITTSDDFDEIDDAIVILGKLAEYYRIKRKEEKERMKVNKKKTPPDDLLDIEEIVAITKESKQTTYRRIKSGEIKSIKLSKKRQIRVWRSVLMKYLHEKRFDL